MDDFEGKLAVVTGGASGIGRAFAVTLVKEGANVVIADIDAGAVEESAAAIGAHYARVDVSDAESVAALARDVTKRFGAVHLLCNNAGIGPLGRIEDLSLADWHWMLGVNLWGVIHGIDAFLPGMVAHGEPAHVVNTASLAGLSTQPMFGAYSVSKYGVVALSEALAAEMAADHPQLGVTVFCPGPIRTRLEQSTRNRPEELKGGLADVPLSSNAAHGGTDIPWMEPQEAAGVLLNAIRDRRVYAITHPALFGRLGKRINALRCAFGHSSSATEKKA